MSEALATTEDGRLRARLVRDEHAENPRKDADTEVHVITIDTHLGQYPPVDPKGGPLAHIWRRLAWNQWKGIEAFTRYVAIMHGGIVLESGPDNGPRSLWYMTGEEMYHLDRGLLSEGYIEAEMQEYEAWLSGDVWTVVIEQTDDPEADEPEWEAVDTVSGFYGGPYARAQAREALRFYAARSAGTSS
ncbi:hypothetical protein [Actinacidiphila glaucinigra]|uniref:Uncharacterized protein n=1 Tax=Actinacidiphila glaucinigra TaxID=235986 RepID=A0A239EZD0_9ACTN|nr:hypothetical protein [Actinacidiphila glaucinigra]SNS49947.1 hypothetical protein SAMN05216252_106230 [Actinacidiphila glaucinigra]